MEEKSKLILSTTDMGEIRKLIRREIDRLVEIKAPDENYVDEASGSHPDVQVEFLYDVLERIKDTPKDPPWTAMLTQEQQAQMFYEQCDNLSSCLEDIVWESLDELSVPEVETWLDDHA
jgi:hypothetical protein